MIDHVTVQTEDLQASVDFYTWLLGMPVTRKFTTPTGEIAFLGAEETKLEFIYSKDYKRTGTAEGITVGFKVDSLDDKIAMLKTKGIQTSPVVSPGPSVRFCFFTDLNGIKMQLVEQK